jgi:nicotinamidase-related amidase
VVAPHRVWGPETSDLVLQLRKRRIGKIILGGMLANMCVESHLREFIEQGFEVGVAKDATPHPSIPNGATATLPPDQPCVSRACSLDDGRGRQGDGARFIKLGQTHGHY